MSAKSWKLVQHTKNGYANLKYKYGDRHFWCRGYYVDTVGKNAKKIEEYEKIRCRKIWNMIRFPCINYCDFENLHKYWGYL